MIPKSFLRPYFLNMNMNLRCCFAGQQPLLALFLPMKYVSQAK